MLLVGCESTPANTRVNTRVPVPAVEQEKTMIDKAYAAIPPQTIEERVGALETKMRDAEPRLKKIDAIDMHFQALSLELKMMGESPDVAVKSPAVAVVPKMDSKVVLKKEIPHKDVPVQKIDRKNTNSSVLSISSMRVGHQGKNIRIVLDATKSAEMHYDLDNAEGLLVIDLPKAAWSAGKPILPKNMKLVQSVDVKTDDAGSHVILQIAEKAKVIATGRLNPSGALGHRVYLDLAPVKN